MKKANDILRVPIIAIAEGEELGRVEDLIIDSENGKVEYLIVNDVEWYLGAKLISFENIKGIGVDVITTDKKSNLKKFSEYENAIDFAKKGIKIIGTKIYTETGVFVGQIDEIVIDENDGLIYGCEMLREKDEGKERIIIPSSSVVTYGKNVSIVIDDVEQTFENDINASNLEKKKKRNQLKDKTEEIKEKQELEIKEEIEVKEEKKEPSVINYEVENKSKEFEEVFDDIEDEFVEGDKVTPKASKSEETLESELNDIQLEKEIEHVSSEEINDDYDNVEEDLTDLEREEEQEDDSSFELNYADEEIAEEEDQLNNEENNEENINTYEEDLDLINREEEGFKQEEDLTEDFEEVPVDLDGSASFKFDINDKETVDTKEHNKFKNKEEAIEDVLPIDVKRKQAEEELEKELSVNLYEKKDEKEQSPILGKAENNNNKDSSEFFENGSEVKKDLKVENLFRKKQREFLIGRVCSKNIENEAGEILIRQGEVISEEIFDKITTSEKLTELTMNSR